MPDYILHKVKKGETIWELSKKYNVPEHKIVQANPDTVKLVKRGKKYEPWIYEGDMIKIPQDSNEPDYRIKGNTSVGMGRTETYELLTREGKMPHYPPEKLHWDFRVDEGGGNWRRLRLEKEKVGQKIFISFNNQKLKARKITIEAFMVRDSGREKLASLIISLDGEDLPEIKRVDLLDANRNRVKRVLSYSETVHARAQCTGMEGETLVFSLWEDDAIGTGHSPENKENYILSKQALVKGGLAEVSFSLIFDTMGPIANRKVPKGQKDEGKYHEYYVTASCLGRQEAEQNSGNVNVNNPDYIPPPKPKPKPKPQPRKAPAPAPPQKKGEKTQVIHKDRINSPAKPPASAWKEPKIIKVYFRDAKGKELNGRPEYGQTLRVYVQSENMVNRKINLKLYDKDTVSDDLLYNRDWIVVSSECFMDVKLTKEMQDMGGDIWYQDIFAQVTLYETNLTVKSEVIEVNKSDFSYPQPEGVKVVKTGKLEEKKGEDCVCKQYDLIWGKKLTCDERKKVIQVCSNIWGESQKKEKANMLMAVMHLETMGTFSPSKENGKGYVGLIQFHSSTAQSLGTTYEALKKMTFIQQMDYVEKYLKQNKDKMKTLVDFYLQVLKPNAVGQGSNPNYIVFDESISVPDGDGSNTPLEQRMKNISREPWVTKYGYSSNPSFMKEDGEHNKRKKWVYTRQKYEDRWGHHDGKTHIWEIEKEIKPKHYDTGIPEKYTGQCVKTKKKDEKKEKGERAPWMEIAIATAKDMKGCVESKEPMYSNAKKYLRYCGNTYDPTDGVNGAWCAAFLNWAIGQTINPKTEEVYSHAKSAASLAPLWTDKYKKISEPIFGCLVVYQHQNKKNGHIGFLYGKTKTGKYILLGGNQDNTIRFDSYGEYTSKTKTKKLYGFYVPKNYDVNEIDKLTDDDIYESADVLNKQYGIKAGEASGKTN